MPTVLEEKPLPVAEARTGDPDAWSVLFHRYQLPLFTYVAELVQDEQTSLDIVQDTFINALRHLPTLADNRKFGSWLFSIAHQKCLQFWRRRHPAEPLDEGRASALLDEQPDPVESVIRQERQREFMKRLDQLPWPQRSALVLHFLEEFSLEEIAEITGVSVGTVKSRIHYGKQALRQALDEESS